MTARSAGKPAAQNSHTVALPIDDVVPDPSQARKTFQPDGLHTLAQSLLETGQISPIVVKPAPEGKYMIVTGERRWRAAKGAGLSHVDCIIRHDIDEQKAREMQFAENYQREDVPPLEQAISWKAYLDNYSLSQSELSRRTGIPQRTISDRLALLSLPASVHAKLKAGEIGPYEAIKISALPAEQQEAVAEAVSSGKIGGRILEKLVKLARAAPQQPVQDFIKELASPEAVPVSPPETTDLPVIKPMSPVHDDIESDLESLKLKKESRKAELEGALGTAKMPSDIGVLVAVARELGKRRRKDCAYEEHGVCMYWGWDRREEISEDLGEPVLIEEDGERRWRIKPSPLYCALCIGPFETALWDAMRETETELLGDPLSGVKHEIICDGCGSEGHVAARIKCTKCGRETWRGWWPKE